MSLRPELRKLLRVFFVVALTYHAASILITLVPRPSALARHVRPLFETYRKTTGTEQDWSMFTSVANRQSSQVEVWSTDAAGRRRAHGAILPGLRDYDTDETFRYHSVFDRFATPRYANYLPAYACKVANIVHAEYGVRPKEIQVVLTAQRIRYLSEIREGGGSTFEETWTSDPIEVDECND